MRMSEEIHRLKLAATIIAVIVFIAIALQIVRQQAAEHPVSVPWEKFAITGAQVYTTPSPTPTATPTPEPTPAPEPSLIPACVTDADCGFYEQCVAGECSTLVADAGGRPGVI